MAYVDALTTRMKGPTLVVTRPTERVGGPNGLVDGTTRQLGGRTTRVDATTRRVFDPSLTSLVSLKRLSHVCARSLPATV